MRNNTRNGEQPAEKNKIAIRLGIGFRSGAMKVMQISQQGDKVKKNEKSLKKQSILNRQEIHYYTFARDKKK